MLISDKSASSLKVLPAEEMCVCCLVETNKGFFFVALEVFSKFEEDPLLDSFWVSSAIVCEENAIAHS